MIISDVMYVCTSKTLLREDESERAKETNKSLKKSLLKYTYFKKW